MTIIWIGVAGFVGAITRYAVDGLIAERNGTGFPWGTFAVNVSGSFLVGFVIAVMAERIAPDSALRPALTVGFLGAYTTFSTFALDTMRLSDGGAMLTAAANVLASVAAAIFAVYLGTWAGRTL